MQSLKSFLFFRFTGAAAIAFALAGGASAQWGTDFPSLQDPEATPSVAAGPVAQTVPESAAEIPTDISLPSLDVSAIGVEESSELNRPIPTEGAADFGNTNAESVSETLSSDMIPAPDSLGPTELSSEATASEPEQPSSSALDALSEPNDPNESNEPNESISHSVLDTQHDDSESADSEATNSAAAEAVPRSLFNASVEDSLPPTTVSLPETLPETDNGSASVLASANGAVSSQSDMSELSARIQALEDQLNKQSLDAAAKKKKDSYKPSVKVGGRLHMDSCWFNQNDASMARAGDCENGSEIRRARIGVQGEYMEQFRYKMDFDFASGEDVVCKDAYAEIIKLPIVSDFRLGYFKESISMEQLTSSNDTWFIERPVCNTGMTGYVMDRSLGMSIGNASQKENYLWNIGVYQPGDDVGTEYRNDNDGWGVTMRYATLLMDDPCNGGNLHVGLGYSYRSWDENDNMNWGTRVESNLSRKVIQTGEFSGTDASHMLAPELMYSFGSFAVQAEYYFAALQNDKYDNPDFTGGYVQVGYWLTGEHYNYEKGRGILGRVKPCHSFFRMCDGNNFLWGTGAWQVVYRFSWLDLSDLELQGADANKSEIGKVYDHTVGLNWHLNNNTRFMFNYVNSTDSYTYGTLNKKGYVDVFTAAFQLVY